MPLTAYGGTLLTFSYNDLGQRTGLTRTNGANTSYTYDGARRLYTLVQNLATDFNATLFYNPASQV